MKALQYRKSVPRYVLLKMLGRRWRRLYTSGAIPLSLRDVAEPTLPTSGWVRVAPLLSGVCGSDLATICATGSPYLAPVTSAPFVMGHELVGRVTETGQDVRDIAVGDRVVLHPALGCRARGIEPRCNACSRGADALCGNLTRGDIAPGLQTGFCRDTGGGFGESLVAHRSQIYRVPDGVDDRAAVLVEPFACALHGALRAQIADNQTVLVIGCGSIGLLTVAALRASGCKARIVAVAKYDHQRRHALNLGANELLDAAPSVAERYRAWASTLGAELLKPELGKPAVVGGGDVTFDCVASSTSLDDGIRFTREGGTLVLVGMPGIPKRVDWTPLWFKELSLHAAYAYGPERFDHAERDTFDVAIDLMKLWGSKLASLVGPPYPLREFRAALASALFTGHSKTVKTVFAPNDGAL